MILTKDLVESLTSIRGIQKVSLCNCELSEDCALAMEDALPLLRCMTTFHINKCKLPDNDAWEACLRGLKGCCNLQELDIVKQVGHIHP
jgi:hypothetical protein